MNSIKKSIFFLNLLLLLDYSLGKGSLCCKDGVFLTRGGCTDGKNLTISCELKYLINGEDEEETSIVINDNNELDFGSATVPPNE